MTFANQEPVKVSPLIKGARWCFLIAGIFYGISKKKMYSILAARDQDHDKHVQEVKHDMIKKEKEKFVSDD